MKPKSAYILGGTAVGKSTLMELVLQKLSIEGGFELRDSQEELHKKQNARYMVTLRGHRLVADGQDENRLVGMYLGSYRNYYPGTDGLDRATSPVASEWLSFPETKREFSFVFGEGNVLATDRFFTALCEHTIPLFIHLTCDPMEMELRMWNRGNGPSNSSFALSTTTRAVNRIKNLPASGRGNVIEADTSSSSGADLEEIAEEIVNHLLDYPGGQDE